MLYHLYQMNTRHMMEEYQRLGMACFRNEPMLVNDMYSYTIPVRAGRWHTARASDVLHECSGQHNWSIPRQSEPLSWPAHPLNIGSETTDPESKPWDEGERRKTSVRKTEDALQTWGSRWSGGRKIENWMLPGMKTRNSVLWTKSGFSPLSALTRSAFVASLSLN